MRFAAILGLLCAIPVFGGRIDVSEVSQITLRTGQTLEVVFSVGSLPSEIGFQALGPAMQSSGIQPLPGSTASYYGEFRFAVGMGALNGGAEVLLFDPAAFRLGLDAGEAVLLAGTASLSGSERDVAVVSALAFAPPADIFGEDLTARAWLRNLGPDVVLGLGPGYTMRSAVSIPGVLGADGTQTAGVVRSVSIYDPDPATRVTANPEPATLALIPAALVLLFALRRRNRAGTSSRSCGQ
ncbi:MAG: PEP-CTERM sorting domain-containing protein [bacterium]|jgi:hypothetical protein